MRTLHPECTHAMVKLEGRKRHSSMSCGTFESRNGRFQRVSDKKAIALYLTTNGFTVRQYDKDKKLLAEAGEAPPAKVQPVKVVKANLAKTQEWSDIEHDDDEMEDKIIDSVNAEQRWLDEINARPDDDQGVEVEVAGEPVKVVADAGDTEIMRHVFAADWTDSMRTFELQAAARKRGLEVEKSAKKAELVELLRADDAARSEQDAAMRQREGIADGAES